MGQSSFTLTGGDIFRKRLQTAPAKTEKALKSATREALRFLEGRAKAKLDEDIYSKNHEYDLDPPDKSDADSLWAGFVQELASVGAGAITASLVNTSPHALFIEQGTDDEGAGSHYVPVIRGVALAWMGAGGEMAFSKGHEVKGIKPYHFMERALFENRAEVIAIYKKHAGKILKG